MSDDIDTTLPLTGYRCCGFVCAALCSGLILMLYPLASTAATLTAQLMMTAGFESRACSHILGRLQSSQAHTAPDPEKEWAKQHCEWAERRCSWSETRIRIQVSKAIVNALKCKELWFGNDWKEYVGFCRKKNDPPQNYIELSSTYDLIKGHICAKFSSRLVLLPQANGNVPQLLVYAIRTRIACR